MFNLKQRMISISWNVTAERHILIWGHLAIFYLRARRIQELADQGLTDESIAQQLGRSTNAIRNYRHRTNIKSKESITIQQLKQEKQKLTKQSQEIEKQIKQLETRARAAELINLKNRRPELFEITGQEQLAKLTAQLGLSLIRWVFE